jgi:hypothetical protein
VVNKSNYQSEPVIFVTRTPVRVTIQKISDSCNIHHKQIYDLLINKMQQKTVINARHYILVLECTENIRL